MSATIKVTVVLSLTELKAAAVATANYTPSKGPWQQSAQSRANTKLRDALVKAMHQV